MLGIDVSKDTLDVALADPATRGMLWDLRTSNTCEGVSTLLERVPADIPWVVEPTGRYSLLVVEQGRQAGRTVLMAPTRQAKRYIESHQSRAKTDKVSARGLALFGLDRTLRAFPLKSKDVDDIDQYLSARRGLSQAITDLSARGRDLPRAKESLGASIAALKQELAALDKRIAKAVEASTASTLSETARRLDAIPGVGAVTSVAFAARLCSKAFIHPDSWVAYCGLDVAVRQSGKRKGELGLTKQGDAELRRLAYVCAQAAVRAKGSPFAAQFERERAKGLSKVASYCAVSRKMLKICWALHHNRAEYDGSLVYLSAQERRKRREDESASATTSSTNAAQAPAPQPVPQHAIAGDAGSIGMTAAEDRATVGTDLSADRGATHRRRGGPAAPSSHRHTETHRPHVSGRGTNAKNPSPGPNS